VIRRTCAAFRLDRRKVRVLDMGEGGREGGREGGKREREEREKSAGERAARLHACRL